MAENNISVSVSSVSLSLSLCLILSHSLKRRKMNDYVCEEKRRRKEKEGRKMSEKL